MVLASIVMPMLLLLFFGREIRDLKVRHYAIVAVITLVQVSVAVYVMYTMERPPLF